ncbi:aspartyl-phosphate phosphatase Spo0E family protein [Halobacillus salinarum]|uniref:Aspartyl-phosphate phosphatase Spo0E family protein n=1 Tax=Halobacillus salinarum TaxID=2932257 RepID=A0ABY4EGY1_9BACI|nr:aspartyl-phosphate phosphatase Spo0E family protein [Halobacillus salinarum]UOQ43317.1 aspartyl-phosphate phosphatase Spo0E family protein [Halobacillus salinarum]
MSSRKHLEKQIETLRTQMYEAYRNYSRYEDIVKISQELDKLLNELNRSRD